jgi:putative phosphoesterase
MKILVLSDIHSNIYALEAIWREQRDSDLILCAGDLVDYGPYPREVLAWVREHGVRCVQGNHDAWLAMNYRQGKTAETVPQPERGWVHHNAALLSEDEVTFLERLPKSLVVDLNGTAWGMTHLYRDYNEIVSVHAFQQFTREAFDSSAGEISRLIMGHTHRQSVRILSEDHLCLNPGSVSYRRKDDPDQSAHYATITGGQIALHRLAYDPAPLRQFSLSLQLSEPEMEHARYIFGTRE